MKLISIVIPLLDEADSLEELYGSITKVAQENQYCYEILFVDDGSRDKSAEIIKSIIDRDNRVRLISFRRNLGKATALQTGFKHSRGDYIITMDADLQDDPAEVPNFVAKLDEGYDLVSGWKYVRNDPLEKRLPSKIFNKMTTYLSGVQLHDFNCGFKAYQRAVIESIDLYGEMHRYIPVIANKYGFKITEIRVNHRARTYGKSKYGLERYLRGLFDSLSVLFLSKYYAKPMHAFGLIGAALFFCGVVICLILSIQWLAGVSIGSSPGLLLGILLMLLGVQSFSTGLLADLFVGASYRNMYNESHVKEMYSGSTNDTPET